MKMSNSEVYFELDLETYAVILSRLCINVFTAFSNYIFGD